MNNTVRKKKSEMETLPDLKAVPPTPQCPCRGADREPHTSKEKVGARSTVEGLDPPLKTFWPSSAERRNPGEIRTVPLQKCTITKNPLISNRTRMSNARPHDTACLTQSVQCKGNSGW